MTTPTSRRLATAALAVALALTATACQAKTFESGESLKKTLEELGGDCVSYKSGTNYWMECDNIGIQAEWDERGYVSNKPQTGSNRGRNSKVGKFLSGKGWYARSVNGTETDGFDTGNEHLQKLQEITGGKIRDAYIFRG